LGYGIIAQLRNDCEETMAESTKEVAASRSAPNTGTGAPATAKKATTKPTPTAEVVTSAPAPKPRFGFFSALGGRNGAAVPAADGKAPSAGQPQRPANPSMGRFFLGMSLYMVLALGAQFALTFIFKQLPASYSTQAIFTLPLLGPVTTYLLVWMATLILILWGLYKFKILPRSLGQPRTAATATKVDPKVKAAPTAKVARPVVEGPDDDAYTRVKARIRAERRKARRN
jgi:hypothetical protein